MQPRQNRTEQMRPGTFCVIIMQVLSARAFITTSTEVICTGSRVERRAFWVDVSVWKKLVESKDKLLAEKDGYIDLLKVKHSEELAKARMSLDFAEGAVTSRVLLEKSIDAAWAASGGNVDIQLSKRMPFLLSTDTSRKGRCAGLSL